MAGVQLFDRLIKATEQIVAKFGKDVLTEERFVNILQDLYPDRDNPAVFRIVKSMINDGYFSELLSCNKGGIRNYVGKTVSTLNQKYGYDKVLVEGIIYSIAVGCGAISQKDINSSTHTPVPSKPTKPTPAKPKRTHNTKQPNKQQTQKHSFGNETIKGIGLLLLSFLGLFLGTFAYVLYLGYSWWLIFVLLLMIILHVLTILPGFNLYKYNNKTYSYIFTAILIFVLLNYIAPLLFLSDSIRDNFVFYWGNIELEKYPYGWIFCFMLLYLIGSIVGSSLKDGMTLFSNSIVTRKGFVITFLILSIIYGLFLYYPEWDKKRSMNRIFEEVSKKESSRDSLKALRSIESRNFQFKGIELLASKSSFLNSIKRDSNFTIKETYDNKGGYISSELELSYNGNTYKDVMESVICCDVRWDNKKLRFKSYFINDMIVAILIKDKDYGNYDYLNFDNVLNMYTKKYGEPELTFISGINTIYYRLNHDYYPSFMNYKLKDQGVYDDLVYRYNWTYKNGGIEITDNNYYRSSTCITYVSSLLIEKQSKHSEKVKELEIIKKKREMDSLYEIRIEKEKREKEEQKRRELEHMKSANQI